MSFRDTSICAHIFLGVDILQSNHSRSVWLGIRNERRSYAESPPEVKSTIMTPIPTLGYGNVTGSELHLKDVVEVVCSTEGTDTQQTILILYDRGTKDGVGRREPS